MESRSATVRLLLLTPFLPHARAAHGGAVYLHALAEALAARTELGLVSFATPHEIAAEPRLPEGLARSWLVVRSDRADGGGASRLAHQLRMLAAWTLGGLPITIAKFRSTVMQAAVAQATAEFRPDAALVEMDLCAQYLPALGELPSVLTDHEGGDPVPAGIGRGAIGRSRDLRLWKRYVERSYRRATRLQALNTEDAARLSAQLDRPVGVRPPLVRLPERAVEPANAPARILFLGDYAHLPNREAARFVAQEVLPRLRARDPAVELWLAGAHATPEIQALGDGAGVRVVGFVEDLAELLGAARVLVAPVFSGGGSRIKVLTALAHGVPVVANELAMRGIDAPPEAARRGEDAERIADAALAWLADPEAAGAAGRAARAWAERAIAPDAVARAQVAVVEEMLATLRPR